jgi:hypothetical protein
MTVAVTAGSDAISCVVEDDGLGFDARAIADARRGFHMGLDSAVNVCGRAAVRQQRDRE